MLVLNRHFLRPALLIAVPGAAILAAMLLWLWSGRYVTTENAYVKTHITLISAEIAGRVLEVGIKDHGEVKAGDVLLTIDPEPFRVALSKADAELDATRDQVRALLVASTRPWVEANFKETELTHVRKGLTATVALDIYPDVVWEAEVESISPATGAEFALLPPQNASGNWVKVVQRLPVRLRLLPRLNEPPLRAGMTATVKVDTRRERFLGRILGSWAAVAWGHK